jgi:hypothetical protein
MLRATSIPSTPTPTPDPVPDPTPTPDPIPDPIPDPEPEPEPELPSVGIPAVMDFQDGVSHGGSYNGTRDASLFGDSSSVKKKNYGTGRDLETNGSPDRSAILSWDVSSIAPGSIVSGAEITLQITGASVETFSLYAVNKSWNETQVTWNQSVKGTNWSSAGAQGTADRGSVSIGTLTATAKGLATITLNAAGIALVQSWVNDPSKNFGIAIQNYAGKSDSLTFASREAKTASQRPKLSVAYGGSSALTESLAMDVPTEPDPTPTPDPVPDPTPIPDPVPFSEYIVFAIVLTEVTARFVV